jgi:hypothetical protein
VLRRMIRRCAPAAIEAIRFHALCYVRPGEAYGAIGGNVCMIEARPGGVRLSFLHGASLPDPHRMLEGDAKAKRYVEIRSTADLERGALRALIRAAVAHRPAPDHRPRRAAKSAGVAGSGRSPGALRPAT